MFSRLRLRLRAFSATAREDVISYRNIGIDRAYNQALLRRQCYPLII